MSNSYDTKESLAHRISSWFEAQGCEGVTLSVHEGSDLAGPNYDYTIVQEVSIRPSNVSELACDISICEDGSIGVGIGSWSDAAARLGAAPPQDKRYLGGFEPTRLASFEDLTFLLGAIRNGEVSAWCFALPVLGIINSRIAVSETSNRFPHQLEKLARIQRIDTDKKPMFGSLLKFDSWT